MGKQITVWKVTVDGCSCIIKTKGLKRHYPKGVLVKPLPGLGPLMAFRTEKAAAEWAVQAMRCGETYRIRKARAVVSKTKAMWVMSRGWRGFSREAITAFWKMTERLHGTSTRAPGRWPVPSSTVFCDEITCLD